MIPAIGLMVAAYIITRMMELIAKPGIKTVVIVFAVITILVTLVSGYDLINAGSRISAGL